MGKIMNEGEYATPFSMLHAANLLGQRSRLEKFHRAIQMVVKERSYVIDLGTGSGILAIMAAKAGASRVSAIEINPETIEYARAAARLNGVEHIIDFVQGSFSDFVPDDKADVVICEMLSSMMLIEQQVPASVHAVSNMLKQGGILIPQEVTVFLVPVESMEMWERFQFQDLNFPRVVQTATPDATRDLADLKVLEHLELMNLKQNISIDQTLQFTIVERGTVHGFVGMFESKLFADIELRMEDGWKQLFIPIERPIEVTKNDVISVRISYQPGKYDSLLIETH